MMIMDRRGILHEVRSFWNPVTRRWHAWAWVGAFTVERCSGLNRQRTINALSRKLWKQGYVIIRE